MWQTVCEIAKAAAHACQGTAAKKAKGTSSLTQKAMGRDCYRNMDIEEEKEISVATISYPSLWLKVWLWQ